MKPSGSVAKLLIKITVSAGLLAYLLSRISIDELVVHLHSLDRWMILLAVAVFFVSNLLGSLQWHLLLNSSGVTLRFGQTFRFYFVGLFFNNFLPANIGGDAVKIYDVTRIGRSVYQVIAVTFLDRLIGIFSLCLLAALFTIYLMASAPVALLWIYLLIFLACMTPVAGFYFVKPLGNLLRRVFGALRIFSLGDKGASILDHLGEFKTKKSFVLKLILLSLVIQAIRVLTHVLVAAALGVSLNTVVVGLFFVFVPLLGLAMIPPITINGLGVREGLAMILFAQAGIGKTDAFTIEFLTYLVSLSVSLFGLAFFVTRRKPGAEPTTDTSGT